EVRHHADRVVSIPSIWDLLLRLGMPFIIVIVVAVGFNPLNMGSASATRLSRLRNDSYLSLFQSPQYGICFCDCTRNYSF
ncbi:MAG: hypothetical protein ACTSSD_15660, partial [Candidatus Thorarchaeota archaeon]